MNLDNIRLQVIKTFITKELLSESIFPTLEKVCAIALSEYDNLPSNASMLNESIEFRAGDFFSRNKLNLLQKYSDIDINTLYKFLEYIEQYLNVSRNSIINKSKAIERAAVILEQKANSLIFLNEDTNYNLDIIDESFNNSSYIDKENTDCNIDYDINHAVSKYSESASLAYIDYTAITSNPISSGYLSFRTSKGSHANTVNGSDYSWVQDLIMPVSYSGGAEISVKIKLSDKKTISRILIGFGNTYSYSLKITALENNIYKTVSDKKYYKKFADISIDPVETDYLILNIGIVSYSRLSYRPEGKVFEFSISQIMTGMAEYAESSTLQTLEYPVSDAFNKVSIYSEEDIPEGCGLNFEITWDDTWRNITPYNRSKIDFPVFLDVLPDYDILKSSETIDLSKTHPHIYGSNICTTYTTDSLENIDIFDIKIIRNINGISLDAAKSLGTVVLYASSQISNIDFTLNPGFLDNILVNGLIDITAGFHVFKFNLNGGLDQYKVFLDSIVSADLVYGSHLAVYMNNESFLNVGLDSNYSIFSFVNISGAYYAVVKALNENVITDYSFNNENMVFIYKDVVSNDLNSLPESLKVRATFNALKYKTPILKSFKIKLGK